MLPSPVPLALAGLNHLLAQSRWARERLQPYAGRGARITMAPLPELPFRIGEDGLLHEAADVNPDVEIALPADTPLRALQGMGEVMKGARISGSADLADNLGFVLRNLRWDAEEDLSKVVGDIAAHRIVGTTASLVAAQQQALRNLSENIAEYLTEEKPTLVKGADLTSFSAELRALNDDIARLEQRLGRAGRP
ncbi:MAG TPA: hypothetical protein VI279_00380 [Rhodocyclaceae bacterium]